jgi:hypothetical protein
MPFDVRSLDRKTVSFLRHGRMNGDTAMNEGEIENT